MTESHTASPPPDPDPPPPAKRTVGRTGARFPSARQLDRLDGDQAPEGGSRPADRRSARRRRSVGRTGARFPSARALGRLDDQASSETESPIVAEPADPEPEDHAVPEDHAEQAEPAWPGPDSEATDDLPLDRPEQEPSPADPVAGIVRPYVLTKGRTTPGHALAVETLLTSVRLDGRPMPASLGEEHRAAHDLCASPRSVAEVAALLALPLGVARVLLGDLAELGLLIVHRSVSERAPDWALMERVLRGLRGL
ncbi:MAG: DUF742 domain-containing protein [Pseudonocardiaceae bacterium]|nr:DUF742 domain-containing protein [Pseudonocardiaceae bacterium]